MADLPPREPVDGVGEDVEPLFHHQPPGESDHRNVVGDSEAAPPGEVAPFGIEDLPVDAAGPDADVVVHALVAEQLGHGIGRREDGVAAAVEAPEDREHHRLEEGQAVIARIGLEAGVDRGDHRQVQPVGEGHRAVAGDLRACDVEDVRPERLEVPAHAGRDADSDPVFGPAGEGHCGDVDQVAGRREGRRPGDRRIGADGRALADEIAGQAVQRLVRPVADVIVIAAEDGDAKVGDVHWPCWIGKSADGRKKAPRQPKPAGRLLR